MSRYKAYPEYAPSDAGFVDELPASWRMLRGKFVFSEYSERSEAGEEKLLSVSEYYGVKPRGEVVEEGDFLSRAESLVGYKKCQKNDLVMNIMLAWKCGLGVSKYDGIVSPAYSVFRFNANAIPDYMHYLLRTETYTGHFKTRSTGVIDSRLRLYPESFGDVSIILPSIIEQEKIVNFLDHETAKIDALIEKQQRLIELLKEKRQAVISHAVTKGLNPKAPMKDSGVEWLGEVPAHWEIRAVSRLCTRITNGYVGPTRDILVDEGVPYVQATHIKKGNVNFDQAYFVRKAWSDLHSKSILQKGDVLIVQTGAGTGDIGLVTEGEVGFNCHALIIVRPNPDVVVGEFLSMLLQSEYGYSVLYSIRTGGMHPHLNCGEVQYVKLPVPPRVEQDEILKFVDTKTKSFNALIGSQDAAIELMQERRTALISAAVTGKIDVRDWQPAAEQEADMEYCANLSRLI